MKVTIYFNQTKSNFIKSLKNGTYPNIPRKVEILDEMIYTDLAFQLELNRDEIDILHNDKSIEKIIEEPEDVMDRSDDILQFSVKYHVIDSGMNHVNGVYILDGSYLGDYPKYDKDNFHIIYETGWKIVITNKIDFSNTILYACNLESYNPPLNNWVSIFGTGVSPILKQLNNSSDYFPNNKGINLSEDTYLYYNSAYNTGTRQSYLISDFQNSNLNNYSLRYNWDIDLEPEPEPEPELFLEPELINIEPEPELVEPEPLSYNMYHLLAPIQLISNFSIFSKSTINFIPISSNSLRGSFHNLGYYTYYDKWGDHKE